MDSFGENVNSGVKSFIFTASKNNLNGFFAVNKGGEAFKNSISTFTTSNYQKSKNIGVKFKLLTNFFLVVFLFKLVADKPARSDDFFWRDAM